MQLFYGAKFVATSPYFQSWSIAPCRMCVTVNHALYRRGPLYWYLATKSELSPSVNYSSMQQISPSAAQLFNNFLHSSHLHKSHFNAGFFRILFSSCIKLPYKNFACVHMLGRRCVSV